MRVLMTTLVASLALAGCATRPQVAHDGDLSPLKGQAVLMSSDPASPAKTDTGFAKALEGQVSRRIGEIGAVAAGAVAPRYRLQVAVATSPGEVGVSTGVGPQVGIAPWRAAPVKRHFWNRRGPVRTTTLSVLDLSSGKVVAWSSVRTSSSDAVNIADRLVVALSPAKT